MRSWRAVIPNVRMLPGAESYDVLVEHVVEQCTTVDEAIALVARLIDERRFAWGNLIVATAHEVAALEVRDRHLEVTRSQAWVARANHQVCLGATPDDDDTLTTSSHRYMAAEAGLTRGRSDIRDICRCCAGISQTHSTASAITESTPPCTAT